MTTPTPNPEIVAKPESPAEPEKLSTWRFSLGLILVAITASLFAIAFRLTLSALLHAGFSSRDIVSGLEQSPWWVRLLLPGFGGLLAGSVGLLVSRTRGGQSVGDVMEAVVFGRVRLSIVVTFLKSIASWCAIACGASLGREGPLIQFGGAAGQIIGERFALPGTQTRLLIAAGTGAGFAAAYNTPFAALLFVLEIVTGVVVLEAMLPAVVAVVLGTVLTRSVVGDGPIYGQRTFALHSPWELIGVAGLGVLCALLAQGFMRFLTFGESLFRRESLKLPWRPAIGGLLAGLVITFLPEVAGNGYEPLNAILDGRVTVGFVILLLLGKCFATTASVSSGIPGGVFTPTLLLGGGAGLLFATAIAKIGDFAIGAPESYALVGMAAASAATTHAPLMAAVLVFELSGDYAIVLPLLLATAVATMLSRAMRRDSIYSAELRERGVAWELTMEGRKLSRPDRRKSLHGPGDDRVHESVDGE